MSFFHVLPSNVAPESFPQNNASAYSTPINNDYHLNGKWEVALLNITYSGCVNTFHHDIITVEKNFELKERLQTSSKPILLRFKGKTIRELVKDINVKLEGVITLTLDEKEQYCTWHINMDGVTVVVSKPLMNRLKLWQDVITQWDVAPANYFSLKDTPDYDNFDYHVIVVPSSHPKTTITLKEENTSINPETFVKRFRQHFKDYIRLEENETKTRFAMFKLHNDRTLIIMSPAIHKMTSFRQAGLYADHYARHVNHDFDNNNFSPRWEVYVYHLDDIQGLTPEMTIPVSLGSHSFHRRQDAVSYLNTLMKKYNTTFTLKNNVIEMEITDVNTSVSFSNTLRDILALDQSTYHGKGIWKGSDMFSLARRIHYLYVYCSVSDYVRIGDTEAPLLAVIPFNPEVCINLLQEKTFKLPMYVPVIQNPISQIDIAIYDGAGELVPFASEAVTSLRLHFRRV